MREFRVASAKQNWKRDRLRGNRCGSLSIIISTIRRATETASSGLNPAALIISLKLSTNREKSMGMLSSGIFFSAAPRVKRSPISRLIRRRRSGFSAMSGAICSNPSIATSNCSTIALICADKRSRRQSIWFGSIYMLSHVLRSTTHGQKHSLFELRTKVDISRCLERLLPLVVAVCSTAV